jgi:hypothetical protein
MDNKKTRRYLVWFLIGVFIIVGGVLGNALLGNGEPMPDQTLKYTQTSNGNIERKYKKSCICKVKPYSNNAD